MKKLFLLFKSTYFYSIISYELNVKQNFNIFKEFLINKNESILTNEELFLFYATIGKYRSFPNTSNIASIGVQWKLFKMDLKVEAELPE